MFILARHGRCADNASKRLPSCNGQLDSVGRIQALRMAELLSTPDWAPTEVVTSALPRAIETGQIVASRLSIPISSDARLNEIDFGEAEGLTEAEFDQNFAAHSQAILDSSDLDFAWPGGECRRDFLNRVMEAVKHALRPGAIPLLVTHWAVSGTLLCQFTRGSIEGWTELGLDHCAPVLVARNQGVWVARQVADIAQV